MQREAQSDVLEFKKRRPTSIQPELKEFLDRAVIPLLVHSALEQLSYEGLVEKPTIFVDSSSDV